MLAGREGAWHNLFFGWLLIRVCSRLFPNDPSEKADSAQIVGHRRNGPIGTVELQFHAAHVRFNDLAHGHGDF